MRGIIKFKWVIFVVWIAAAVGLLLGAPNMNDLVRDKGQITVPDGYSSTLANELLAELGGNSEGVDTAVVFHKEDGFDEASLAEVQQGTEALKNAEVELGIISVNTHFDTPDLAEQMYSADKKTVLALVTVELGERSASEVRDQLYATLDEVTVDHYLTGDWIISEDVIQSSQDGLKKTEIITVAFILVILFIVFRSAAAPFVPLLTVGLSYLISSSIVAYLVDLWNFPLSNFTQIFLVAVLFGIGTDYCILLISRFKEEYAHSNDKNEAIIRTYRTAGKTVLYSGLAVLVGFVSIGFSTFILYRSAVAVAVGIFVMMLALYTLVPFFLSILGKGLFWPAKGSIEHKQSKLWGNVGQFALKKPLGALLILAVIIVPLLIAQRGMISYNSLDEIGEKYNSVKGFNIIAESFGPGEAMPATVVVKAEQPFDTSEGLGLIELATRDLLEVEGVDKVRSATRPIGKVLEDFLVADQVTLLEDGLEEGNDGLTQIRDGLFEASTALEENAPQLTEASNGAAQLAKGTNEMKDGIAELTAGLEQLYQGMKNGSMGAAELRAGLEQAKQSAQTLKQASKSLLEGYQSASSGITSLLEGYEAIAAEQSKLASGLEGVEQGIQSLASSYPELANDNVYQQLVQSMAQLKEGASVLGTQLSQLNIGLANVQGGLTEANTGLSQATAGQQSLADGLSQIVDGILELEAGMNQLTVGQQQVITKLPTVQSGLTQIADGQTELADGFATIQTQLNELTTGLNQSVDGLEQVTDGISSASAYLNGLIKSPDKQLTGWYIPDEAIESEELQEVFDIYMSEDRKTITFDVVFSMNPYSIEAMSQVDQLSQSVRNTLSDTIYADADVQVGGVTSMNHDLNVISDEDYSRTMILMLFGITLILLVLFRSVVIPLYIVLSLWITFNTSLALTELIYVNIFGLSGVSWAVPFFGFVLLMALGVDYSIFLMDRFRENAHMDTSEAILEAMKSMGSVIISAAVILGGTFAAMLPSGVMSLLQIATLVLSGLFLYALVMLPLFIPVMVKLFGKYNWWPFMKRN